MRSGDYDVAGAVEVKQNSTKTVFNNSEREPSDVNAQQMLIGMSANCENSEKDSMKTFDVDPPSVSLLYTLCAVSASVASLTEINEKIKKKINENEKFLKSC